MSKVRCILFDVEGTVSSIKYVHDVLFPYARTHLPSYVEKHWSDDAVKKSVDLLAKDLGFTGTVAWFAGLESREDQVKTISAELARLMDSDVKSTGLKSLQGSVWAIGYDAGELNSHIYNDVPSAFKRWHADGIEMRIYSSGSIKAQQVYFAHTEFGSLSGYLSGHYDTTVGPKRDSASYLKIAGDVAVTAAEILFLSDIVEELDAAKAAGMQVALVERPGNASTPAHSYDVIKSFEALDVSRGQAFG